MSKKTILKNILKRQKYPHYLSIPFYIIKSYIMTSTRTHPFTLLNSPLDFFSSGHLELVL